MTVPSVSFLSQMDPKCSAHAELPVPALLSGP
jgi:hypothetical protein